MAWCLTEHKDLIITADYWSTANQVSNELNDEWSNQFLHYSLEVIKLVKKFHNVQNLNFTATRTTVHNWPFSSTKLHVSSFEHYFIKIPLDINLLAQKDNYSHHTV